MENRINIAKLLKDCPKGMELDCTMFEDVYFDCIDDVSDIIKCYIQDTKHKIGISFNKYGQYSNISKTKCVIFPKGKTSWEEFHRPFKDGDIIAEDDGRICIYKNDEKIKNTVNYYCGILSSGDFRIKDEKHPTRHFGLIEYYHLATEEKRQRLFEAIRVNGFRWNEETKSLEKLVAPNFKVGNKIIRKGRKGIDYPIEVLAIENGMYKLPAMSMPIDSQDEWELVSDKFDINTFKPFESRVLVRNADGYLWKPAIYGFSHSKMFYVVGGLRWVQCIPYEENKHMIGTTDDCLDFYKTWEK